MAVLRAGNLRELLQFERQFCACDRRFDYCQRANRSVKPFEAVAKCVLGECSTRLGVTSRQVYDAIRGERFRGKEVTYQDVNNFINNPKRADHEDWEAVTGLRCETWTFCRTIMRTLLRLAFLDQDEDGEAKRKVTDRMVDYFFGSEYHGQSLFLTEGLLQEPPTSEIPRSPQRPEEAAYELLSFAHRYAHDGRAEVWLVSGGSPFAQGVRASPISDVTLALAVAGVTVVFVYADLGEGMANPAKDSVTSFFEYVGQVLKGEMPLADFAGGFRDADAIDDDLKSSVAENRLRALALNPALSRRAKDSGRQTDLWTGQFLNPVFRYAYLAAPSSQYCFVSRESTERPFAYPTSRGEREAFAAWWAWVKTLQHDATWTSAAKRQGSSGKEPPQKVGKKRHG